MNNNNMIDKSNSSSSDKILYLLKTTGPKTAGDMAKMLSITSMGARQHLQNLTDKGFIEYKDIKQGRGRPARYWMVTKAADRRFPDSHSELTLQLITAVEDVFGEQGVNEVIAARQKSSLEKYQYELNKCSTLAEKLQRLIDIRSAEGYMANIEETENGFVMYENHCPISSAANKHHILCDSERELFQLVLGEQIKVERIEHVFNNARRCSYLISDH